MYIHGIPSDNSGYRAALYMRLSKDDAGALESASIQTQRNMLMRYAAEQGFDVCEEYTDDGFSGTNFERPAWQRMIQDIENHKINMVLTKDLSRLGRDYIMAGQYTEVYFPSKGVGCIAVNDGYDSRNPFTDIVPFKNILNEMYARDTSRKIKSALQTKMKEGCFIGNQAPYGYKKDAGNKSRLVLDIPAAEIVRHIFIMAAGGAKPSDIAKQLNGKGILTPSAYKRVLQNGGSREAAVPDWTAQSICKILKNQVYAGHMAQGKTAKVSFKSKMVMQKDSKDWIIVKNTHEPVISEEIFEAANKRSISRRESKDKAFYNAFAGIIRCGDCGSGMTLTCDKSGQKKYVCTQYKIHGRNACTPHRIAYSTLYRYIEEAMSEEGVFLQEVDGILLKMLLDTIEIGERMERNQCIQQDIVIHFLFQSVKQHKLP